MKNNFKKTSLVLVILLMLVNISCKKELDQQPLDKFASTEFWTTEDNAYLALMGLYRGNIFANAAEFNPNDWWGSTGLNWLEMATDNAYPRTGDAAAQNKLTNGTLTSNIAILGNYWSNSYSRIAHCNDFLEHIGAVAMNETRRARMIAEVKFIRASQYFYLSQHFGSAPLITRVLTPEEANVVTKATHQQLVDFVIAEYTAAIPDLPRQKDLPVSEIGRAPKQVALAFLGRIQLAEGKFADAAATYKTIIDFGDNIIDPNYQSIFLEANENSSENIFSTQYVPNLIANPLMQHLAPSVGGGFNLVNPLGSLFDAYQFTDGTPFSYTDPKYNSKDLGQNRDPRLRYTLLYDNSPYGSTKFISNPDSLNARDRLGNATLDQTGFGIRKYMNESFTTSLAIQNGSNLPIIRYAEVLLSYLEAKMEAGQTIDVALLDATVNRVRGRQSVNMPKITVTEANTLRPLLRNERRVELALEGIRLWDLLRWKIADQVLKGDFYGHPFPGIKTAIKKKSATAPNDPYSRWYVTSKAFRKGIDEYWPVPQAEVNINPNLK
jgi:hypothetical protein